MLVSWSCSSTTMLVQSVFDSGQQFKIIGKKSSSELLVCHFKSGDGKFERYAREPCTSSMLLAYDCLFKLGCTIYLNSELSGLSLKQARSAFAVSKTVTWNCPMHRASHSMLPSIFNSALTFSSISTFTDS